MNISELHEKLVTVVPEARLPNGVPQDDLYPFRFASSAFVPPFMDALVRVAVRTDDADDSVRERLRALAGLLEQVFAEGDDETVDALAMRLVHSRLCPQPKLLEAAWPYLGAETRRVVGKFQRLEEECARREAAVRGRAGGAAGVMHTN